MTTQIDLPRDVEGREIPIDTKTLYGKDGEELGVRHFEFNPISGEWIIAALKDGPSNWRAVENNDAFLSMECAHMNQAGDMCGHCKFHNPLVRNRSNQMVEDIASRIRKLRGEDDA